MVLVTVGAPYFDQNKGNILCIQDCQYENGIISVRKLLKFRIDHNIF